MKTSFNWDSNTLHVELSIEEAEWGGYQLPPAIMERRKLARMSPEEYREYFSSQQQEQGFLDDDVAGLLG